MAIQKNANLDISVAAEQNPNYNVKPSVQFSTQDRNTAKYTFTVKQNNKAVDLTDVTATVTLFMADKSVFQNNATVTNAKEGKIDYIIPSDAIRHHGSAKGELKLTYANGDALGGLRFSFNIEQSLIDKVDGSQKEVYIEDFQTISNTVKKKAEEVTVKLDELDEEYQNKAYTVDEKLADVQATVNDLRENGTGIDAQARQEVEHVSARLAEIALLTPQPNGTDDTNNIQAVLNTGASRIRIPDGIYKIDGTKGIRPMDNQIIEFSQNAFFEILPTSANTYDGILIDRKENITIINAKIKGDKNEHLGTTGEHGMGLRVLSSKNISVLGGFFNKCWGDGIYIGSHDKDRHVNCENITIENVVCDDNRRQGISITGCHNALIKDSVFSNTSGFNPRSGVDIESNTIFSSKNIIFENCISFGNEGSGFLCSINSGGTVSDVEFNNCKSYDNLTHGFSLNGATNVSIFNADVYGNTENGIYAIVKSSGLKIDKTTLRDNGDSGLRVMSSCDNARITNSKIVRNVQHGIFLKSLFNKIDNCEISNNLHGVYIDSGATNNILQNSEIHNNLSSGVYITGEYFKLINNQINSNGKGVESKCNIECYSKYPLIKDNIVKMGDNEQKPQYGLRMTNSTSPILVNNDFTNSGVTQNIYTANITDMINVNNFHILPVGTSNSRPTLIAPSGFQYYDTTLNKPIWKKYGSNSWVDATGATV